MNVFLEIAQASVDYYWASYDKLKELESVMSTETGKSACRRGQLAWKTKALIVEDGTMRLKELCTVNQK